MGSVYYDARMNQVAAQRTRKQFKFNEPGMFVWLVLQSEQSHAWFACGAWCVEPWISRIHTLPQVVSGRLWITLEVFYLDFLALAVHSSWLSEHNEWSHTQLMWTKIRDILCMQLLGSKVITVAMTFGRCRVRVRMRNSAGKLSWILAYQLDS